MKKFAYRWLAVVLWVLLSHALVAADLPPPEPVQTLSPAYSRCVEMIARTRQMLKDQDTKGLEALAAELRASKDSLDGGTWLLSHFYGEVADVFPEKEPEAGQAMKFYESWAAASPQSITAQVCLARALTSHAWVARGTGWSDSVTEEGWKHFGERLDRAREVLNAAKKLEEKCPGWYEVGQTVALGQGWEPDEYMKFVDEAIAKEPTYGRYYTNVCKWLMPRWYGHVGDFENWIAEKADTYPDDKRDMQYARFVWMADQAVPAAEMVFESGRLDWARTKRGFEKWLEKDPDNLNVRFEFTRLALLAGDRKTARAQYDITGGKYFGGKGNEESFEKRRKYAYEGGPNPLRVVKAKPKKSESPFSPEALRRIESVLRISGGVIGGVLAGFCLLVLSLQRREPVAGTVAFGAALLLGTFLGTLATLLPGACLYLYFKWKRLSHPPELAPSSGWIVLLWFVILAGTPLLLQVGAANLQLTPFYLEHGAQVTEEKALEVVREHMRDGSIMRISIAAAWVGFLGLLIACGPQNLAGWKRRLGLYGVKPLPTALWMLGAAVVIGVMVVFSDKFMDKDSRKSLELIAEGIHSPIWFFLAVVIVAPICEELLFRGYAFSGWVGKITPWGAIFAPAIIFTFCHVQYGWAGLLYVFVLGASLGVVRWRTGSVYPCIALHLTANLFSFMQVALAEWQ